MYMYVYVRARVCVCVCILVENELKSSCAGGTGGVLNGIIREINGYEWCGGHDVDDRVRF